MINLMSLTLNNENFSCMKLQFVFSFKVSNLLTNQLRPLYSLKTTVTLFQVTSNNIGLASSFSFEGLPPAVTLDRCCLLLDAFWLGFVLEADLSCDPAGALLGEDGDFEFSDLAFEADLDDLRCWSSVDFKVGFLTTSLDLTLLTGLALSSSLLALDDVDDDVSVEVVSPCREGDIR